MFNLNFIAIILLSRKLYFNVDKLKRKEQRKESEQGFLLELIMASVLQKMLLKSSHETLHKNVEVNSG